MNNSPPDFMPALSLSIRETNELVIMPLEAALTESIADGKAALLGTPATKQEKG